MIWVYVAEVFPTRVRSKGQSVGSSWHWTMNAIIAGAFPLIAARSLAAPFFFFAAMMLLQFSWYSSLTLKEKTLFWKLSRLLSEYIDVCCRL